MLRRCLDRQKPPALLVNLKLTQGRLPKTAQRVYNKPRNNNYEQAARHHELI